MTRRIAAGILIVATAMAPPGCTAGWHQPSPVETARLDSRQQVQVWRRGAAVRWHAVRVSADSISGVPYLRPVGCDSCRLSYPRAAVDSIRLGQPVAAFWKTVGVVVGVGLAILAVGCAAKGCPTRE